MQAAEAALGNAALQAAASVNDGDCGARTTAQRGGMSGYTRALAFVICLLEDTWLSSAFMEQFAIGLWGCYFGTAFLMLVASVFAFTRSVRRLAINAAFWALASIVFALTFLGILPVDSLGEQMRFQAHVAVLMAALLAYMLLSVLNIFRRPAHLQRAAAGLAIFAAALLMGGWFFPPQQALELSVAAACLLAVAGLGFGVRSAVNGDRLAWLASFGVFFMLVALVGLSWIALNGAAANWPVHAVSAATATAYLVCMAWVVWSRYSFLLLLHEVMAQGPSYDPVTRMHLYTHLGHMTGSAPRHARDDSVPLGVIVVSIGNLYALQKLYGLPALNYAMFVSAGRLRDTVPANVELGRLADDGFLLWVRNCQDSGQLIALAHTVRARLSRAMALHLNAELGLPASRQARWVADVGVGVLRVPHVDSHATSTVDRGRGMSRTAWSFPSRVAWYDETSGEITGLPAAALG